LHYSIVTGIVLPVQVNIACWSQSDHLQLVIKGQNEVPLMLIEKETTLALCHIHRADKVFWLAQGTPDNLEYYILEQSASVKFNFSKP